MTNDPEAVIKYEAIPSCRLHSHIADISEERLEIASEYARQNGFTGMME